MSANFLDRIRHKQAQFVEIVEFDDGVGLLEDAHLALHPHPVALRVKDGALRALVDALLSAAASHQAEGQVVREAAWEGERAREVVLLALLALSRLVVARYVLDRVEQGHLGSVLSLQRVNDHFVVAVVPRRALSA